MTGTPPEPPLLSGTALLAMVISFDAAKEVLEAAQAEDPELELDEQLPGILKVSLIDMPARSRII